MLSNVRKYVKPKPISYQNKITDTTAQLEKKFLQPTCSKCICFSVCDSVREWGLSEGYRVKECLWERTVIFLSACIEGILRLFTNFYMQRNILIFLRNDRDCKYVDPYKARKRYTGTESLDLIVSLKILILQQLLEKY